ncbi:MAG: DNA primase [Pseudomonadota bacterium]
MAGRIPQSFVDDLLARTDIVGVIEARVPLKRAGRNYSACCPFHKEKTPSFSVSPDKQFYYCFGCGATGNAIGFLMEYERRSFPEAVQELADRAGLTVPHEGGDDDGHAARNRALYDILADGDRFYREQLRKNSLRERAVNYLKKRGLTGEIAQRFGLGYAPPGWDNLLSAAGTDDNRKRLLVDSGLVVAQDGKTYDRFRDRVMFPIRDQRGRVIGFGGRVLGDEKPKYLNSPETPVFHKGRELYGLYEAKQANRTLERLLVVEGYMDVIALAQQGITNAVATLGTACTPDHIDLLYRQAGEIVFCFDGDAAGRKAAWRALETTLPKMLDGRSARVLFLPPEHDPDSLVRAEGPDAFTARLAQADSLDDVLLRALAARVDMTRTDGRARLAALAKPYVAQIPGEVLKALVTQKLADLAQVDPRLLAAAPPAAEPRAGDTIDPPTADDGPPPPFFDDDAVPTASRRPRRGPPAPLSAAGHAIRNLLVDPALAHETDVLPELRGLEQPDVELLFEVLDILRASEHPSVPMLFGRLQGSARYDEFIAIVGRDLHQPEGDHEEARDARRALLAGSLRRLELAWWDGEIARELRRTGGPDAGRLRELYARQQTLKSAAGTAPKG